jgi:hypothetical protein
VTIIKWWCRSLLVATDFDELDNLPIKKSNHRIIKECYLLGNQLSSLYKCFESECHIWWYYLSVSLNQLLSILAPYTQLLMHHKIFEYIIMCRRHEFGMENVTSSWRKVFQSIPTVLFFRNITAKKWKKKQENRFV